MLKILISGILLSSFFLFGIQTENHAPVVKIIQPQVNAAYTWNSPAPFSIEVSDAEDGESKYQEIQTAEVLVKLKYIENSAKASAYLKQKKFSDTIGVMNMLVSNCFNCHGVRTKMAGPSFQDISKKYQNTIPNRDQLVNHIQKGSTGIWGKESMPTHPELTDSIARKMVKWIFTYANDPGLNYFVGLQGALPLNKPAATTRQGFFVVTAFYTDHGTPDLPNKRMTGSDQMILKMK